MLSTSKKIFTPLSIILVICQLVLASNFLLTATPATAEEETAPPDTVVVETPEETLASPEQSVGGLASPEPSEGGPASPEPSEGGPVETPEETLASPEPSEGGPAATEPGNTGLASPEPSAGGPAQTSLSMEGDPLVTPTPDPEPLVCTEETPVFVIGGGSASSAPVNEPISLDLESLPLVGPRVLALFAMDNNKDESGKYLGTDNDSALGAQFLPSSQYQVNKTVAVCALVMNSAGASTVTASLSYPSTIATSTAPTACGQKLNPELSLTALEPSAGQELFCQKIKNSNNNLPTFYDAMNFDTLCAPGSEFMAGSAQVYCAEQNLAYNDPAGDYALAISATDSAGRLSPALEGSFKYLELTAYAVDFDNISYGPVQPHTPKVIVGDTTWDTPLGPNPATVSNVGNTRLRLVVKQNDFGLGKTGPNWNVSYSAKIGDSDFVSYSPDTPTALAKTMELGETNSLTFSIYVFDFPTDTTASYAGEMFLTAEKSDFLPCQ
ncbi:hypothetical protein GYA13_00290 [Candidatus Kuenenbacteria bacterium]|nr:hypothetical protein [Candidatus Kuenenbacteria bacterium]